MTRRLATFVLLALACVPAPAPPEQLEHMSCGDQLAAALRPCANAWDAPSCRVAAHGRFQECMAERHGVLPPAMPIGIDVPSRGAHTH